jgi:hypothetical protein
MSDPNQLKYEIYTTIKDVVYTILENENLLKTDWHLGKVKDVISPTLLNVFVDGSKKEQQIPCNPKVTFAEGEEVYVLFINGKSIDKYVPFHRGII